LESFPRARRQRLGFMRRLSFSPWRSYRRPTGSPKAHGVHATVSEPAEATAVWLVFFGAHVVVANKSGGTVCIFRLPASHMTKSTAGGILFSSVMN
jgi:hypothetical protein